MMGIIDIITTKLVLNYAILALLMVLLAFLLASLLMLIRQIRHFHLSKKKIHNKLFSIDE
ncbi:MAG: hypothetical protein JJV97_03260 [SAR324 cluster bacterium]|nr:hypothetical protein [SAR324 cluster bacterium]